VARCPHSGGSCVNHSQALEGGRIKTIATLAIAIALGTSASAHPQGDATRVELPGCRAISPDSAQRQRIEADIGDFVQAVPQSASVHFQVQDCDMDGQLYNGKTIVLSARLARLPQGQRFFIIAHEFGHHQLEHQALLGNLLARIAGRRGERTGDADMTEIAYRTEFEADAFAVRMMHAQGVDPEDAALLFDSLGAGRDNATHPAFARRAQAIRDVIATLGRSTPPKTQ
jgi:Zn-dependent protease with chaperone function